MYHTTALGADSELTRLRAEAGTIGSKTPSGDYGLGG